MFGVSIDKVQKPFEIYFGENNENHSYCTRSTHHLHMLSAKLDLCKTTIKYRGAIAWNLIS